MSKNAQKELQEALDAVKAMEEQLAETQAALIAEKRRTSELSKGVARVNDADGIKTQELIEKNPTHLRDVNTGRIFGFTLALAKEAARFVPATKKDLEAYNKARSKVKGSLQDSLDELKDKVKSE